MNDTLVYVCWALVAVLLPTLSWVQFHMLRTSRAAWEKERQELQALVSERLMTPSPAEVLPAEVLPPEKRTLWRIGDRTEADLGNGVFTLAMVFDFDDTGGRDEVVLRFENSQTHSSGFWTVPVDDLRKPRAGLPEPLPSVEEPPAQVKA